MFRKRETELCRLQDSLFFHARTLLSDELPELTLSHNFLLYVLGYKPPKLSYLLKTNGEDR